MKSVALFAVGCLLLAHAVRGSEVDPIEKAREAQRRVDATQEELIVKVQQVEDEFARKVEPLAQERGDLLKHIKGFWGGVILAHPSHGLWTNAQDQEIIKNHLVDVRVETIGDTNIRTGSHYKISLTFSPNHFFSDTTLWREVNGVAEDDTAKWSGVSWSDGHAPSASSFFNFFEARDARANMLEGYHLNDVAHVFRYEFWPNPFTYYDLPTMDMARHTVEHEEYLKSLEEANSAAGGVPLSEEPAEGEEEPFVPEDVELAAAEQEGSVAEEKPLEIPSPEQHEEPAPKHEEPTPKPRAG